MPVECVRVMPSVRWLSGGRDSDVHIEHVADLDRGPQARTLREAEVAREVEVEGEEGGAAAGGFERE